MENVEFEAGINAYNYTWALSESRWAWEFLRRNAAFRKIAAQHDPNDISTRKACNDITIVRPKFDQTEAQRWGLVCMPDPDENGFDANVFWSSALYPRAISIHVSQRSDDELDDIFTQSVRNCTIVHLTDLAGREHLLIKGNGRVVQVECTGLSLLSLEPVRMKLIIDTLGDFDQTLAAIERGKELYDNNLQTAEPVWTKSAMSLRNALVALDCHDAGLSYLETAVYIYGKTRAQEAWSGTSRAMKDEIKRALTRGKELRDGAYTTLLNPEAKKRQTRGGSFAPYDIGANPLGV